MFKSVASECAAKEGATSADVDDAYSKKMPSSTGAKCMHACIGETIGAVSQMTFKNKIQQILINCGNLFRFKTKNSQMNVDGVVALAKMAFGDDAAKLQTARDIASDCIGVTDGDRCEAALKLLECSVNAHKSRGLDFGDW